MTSPYKSVSWTEEPIDVDKLNQMTSNDQWLFENTLRTQFRSGGIVKSSGMKILSGIIVVLPNRGGVANNQVTFGNFFTAGCPVVCVVSANSPRQGRLHVWTSGLSDYYPDHRGFRVFVSPNERDPKQDYINASLAISYACFGY